MDEKRFWLMIETLGGTSTGPWRLRRNWLKANSMKVAMELATSR